MKRDDSKRAMSGREAELGALAALPDERIDTSDAPEQRDWNDARRGVFFRPVKRRLTLRLDADVIEWFKLHARGERGYQMSNNSVLLEYVARQGRA